MKYALSIIVALAFCVTAAVAQAGGAGPAGTQSSPGMQQPGTQQPGAQPGMGQQPEANPPMDQNTENKQNNAAGNGGEKKMKGCVQSQGGQYTLETKKGKEIALTGQDVSAHVGHEVEVKGSWEKGGNSGMTQSSSGNAGEKTFNVQSVKMISDTCTGKKGGSSSMGTAPGGTNPNGTGSSTGSPSGTGPASTPTPQ